jgi:hypothetical protein
MEPLRECFEPWDFCTPTFLLTTFAAAMGNLARFDAGHSAHKNSIAGISDFNLILASRSFFES